MSVFRPQLICLFLCAILEQEIVAAPTTHTIKLKHVKEGAFHTPGTLFCIAHFFLPLQALES